MKDAEISNQNATIAVFETYQTVTDTLKKLQRAGYNMSKLSVVGKDNVTKKNPVGYYPAGALWENIKKLPLDSAFFSIPGFGPFFIAGPILNSLQNSLVASLEGDLARSRSSAFEAALISLGIPKNFAFIVEDQVKTGHYLLIAHGTMREVEKANWVFGYAPLRKSSIETAAA
ncbi:DUF1269 domain-containing protein [Spirosoma sp. BT702]|uniref:DUF1269 domain-containing protein n=2 Tax=Spirosoma profusum TaxID=2771354 RepID=A0A927GAW9_9BACT|nr:DUF1269 domain-containing protein [Spirosoma profusum]